ncbi:hypothetical protein Mgra_00008692 [Meloidogyne graminicola]|uniref:Uncharacterized protein n=1 Tax=Meloidogyne graminicola TaxID=189291 RepID=A0A8S9ZF77_9BILA|nr:hypothetical protein Mgra_00008692 [Meloidogyne graminicola]
MKLMQLKRLFPSADKGQGEFGNKMPKMRNNRYVNVISNLNKAFNIQIINELERIELPKQNELIIFTEELDKDMKKNQNLNKLGQEKYFKNLVYL